MKRTRKIFIWVCLLIVGLAVFYIAYTLGVERQNHRVYETMQSSVPTEPSIPEESSVAPTSAPPDEQAGPTEETKAPFQSPLDFIAIQRTNQDIYAWIDILGTDISYPVLQHSFEDDYYLMHTVDGTYGRPGAIYTHTYAAKDFSDFVTVVYGHTLAAGAMFTSLKDYRDESFLQEHRTIMMYTPYATYEFTVFAAVLYNNLLINTQFDFETDEGKLSFLNSLDDTRNLNNHILDDIPVGIDDHILVLSTCRSGDPDHRYLVLAVMTNVEE